MLSPPHTAILSVEGGHLSFTGEKTIRSWSQSHRRSQHSNDVGLAPRPVPAVDRRPADQQSAMESASPACQATVEAVRSHSVESGNSTQAAQGTSDTGSVGDRTSPWWAGL